MSSVRRFAAQTPARTFFNEAGADLILAADLATWASNQGAVVNGSIILLNKNDTAFGVAMYDLFSNYSENTDSQTPLLDMGKKVYIGMPNGTGSELAGESQIITMNLVKVLQGSNRGMVGYVITATNITATINSEGDGYLDVDVGGGAA